MQRMHPAKFPASLKLYLENAFWVQRDAQIQVNEFSRAFNQRPSGGSSESPAIGYGVMILGVLGYVAYQWLSGFFHSVFG